MPRVKTTHVLAALAATALALSGCPEKGPAQKAGEKIDETVDKLTHPNEGSMERAGRKLDDEYEKAKEAVKGK
jgi:PBP1b-binding outer membrane lipoprotein LpoB